MLVRIDCTGDSIFSNERKRSCRMSCSLIRGYSECNNIKSVRASFSPRETIGILSHDTIIESATKWGKPDLNVLHSIWSSLTSGLSIQDTRRKSQIERRFAGRWKWLWLSSWLPVRQEVNWLEENMESSIWLTWPTWLSPSISCMLQSSWNWW